MANLQKQGKIQILATTHRVANFCTIASLRTVRGRGNSHKGFQTHPQFTADDCSKRSRLRYSQKLTP